MNQPNPTTPDSLYATRTPSHAMSSWDTVKRSFLHILRNTDPRALVFGVGTAYGSLVLPATAAAFFMPGPHIKPALPAIAEPTIEKEVEGVPIFELDPDGELAETSEKTLAQKTLDVIMAPAEGLPGVRQFTAKDITEPWARGVYEQFSRIYEDAARAYHQMESNAILSNMPAPAEMGEKVRIAGLMCELFYGFYDRLYGPASVDATPAARDLTAQGMFSLAMSTQQSSERIASIQGRASVFTAGAQAIPGAMAILQDEERFSQYDRMTIAELRQAREQKIKANVADEIYYQQIRREEYGAAGLIEAPQATEEKATKPGQLKKANEAMKDLKEKLR